MPEYADIVVYIEALQKRIHGRTLERVHLASPFLLRTAVPSLWLAEGKKVVDLRRLGKRICIGLEGDLWLVLHLMIAGRLHWKDTAGSGLVRTQSNRAATTKGKPKFSKRDLAAFQFENGILSLTEAGTQRRASLQVVEGEERLDNLDPGGLELFQRRDRDEELHKSFVRCHVCHTRSMG